ncbi:glycosyltransferase family 2 protein [soil metagenome]
MPPLATSQVLSARMTVPSRRGTASALLSVVVPLYDEQETLPELYRRLTATLQTLQMPYELVFVDDGSRDATPRLLAMLSAKDANVVAVHLSRNFGHQAAVSAGLDHARGDVVAVMDGDLQDPPEELPRFLAAWRQGFEVVYAVRRKRKEHALKRLSYYAFYRLFNRVSDLDMPLDAGDFCLLDRKAVDALTRLPERVRFVRGLRRFVGFKQIGVEYERDRRAAGVPKYTLRRLIGLAVDGLFNFSAFPLRLITGTAFVSLFAATILTAFAIATPSQILTLLAIVCGFSGVQFLALSIVGEYLRRILLEVKGRPTYIVADVVRHDPAEQARRVA